MVTQYLTLKKSDSEFSDYLWGRSPKLKQNHQRAIPVKTYNLGTAEESVTFELKKISDILKPNAFQFFASMVKLNSFILILFPLFYLLIKNEVTNSINDPFALTLAVAATLFLFAGLNIRNDVFDHISGFDRVNLDSVKKPIRQGWISASTASHVSLVLILISAVLAVPVVLLHLALIKLVAAVIVLFLLGRFIKNNSYKYQRLGELILFALVGPLLSVGYQLSMGAVIDNEVVSFGLLWGVIVIYLLHINNFSHIMTSSLSGIRNTMTNLGFDRSQKFLIWGWGFILLSWLVFHLYFLNVFMALGGGVVILLASVPLYNKISHIKSPMGSGLQQIRKQTQKTFLVLLAVFILETLSQFWVAAL